MTRKIPLETLAQQIAAGFSSLRGEMQSGFAKQDKEIKALTETAAFIVEHVATKAETATKQQIVALHGQVNAIESDLRTTKRHKLITRVADLEEELFGKPRG
jgi:hypothetical protein